MILYSQSVSFIFLRHLEEKSQKVWDQMVKQENELVTVITETYITVRWLCSLLTIFVFSTRWTSHRPRHRNQREPQWVKESPTWRFLWTRLFRGRPGRGSSLTALWPPCAGCCVLPAGPGSAEPSGWGSLCVCRQSVGAGRPRCRPDGGGSVGPRPRTARLHCAGETPTSQWTYSQTPPHTLGPLGKKDTYRKRKNCHDSITQSLPVINLLYIDMCMYEPPMTFDPHLRQRLLWTGPGRSCCPRGWWEGFRPGGRVWAWYGAQRRSRSWSGRWQSRRWHKHSPPSDSRPERSRPPPPER